MRHNVSGKKLSRDTSHRKALLKNLSTSLVEHGSIVTTLTKAKYVKPYVEKLVTKARGGDLSGVRLVRRGLTTDAMTRKLVSEVAPKFAKRPGGYTRIKKLGRRDGDNAPMARLEWALEVESPTKARAAKKASQKTEEKNDKKAEGAVEKKVASKTVVKKKATATKKKISSKKEAKNE